MSNLTYPKKYLFAPHGVGAIELDHGVTGVGDLGGLGVQVKADDHLEGVDLARVHPVLGVREGDQLVTTRHLDKILAKNKNKLRAP